MKRKKATYKIVRFFYDERPSQELGGGLSLKDAQKHCKDPESRKDGDYFDGYTEEKEVESYPEYLRRVAADYRETDSDSPTAEDYDESAQLIEDLTMELEATLVDSGFSDYHTKQIKALLKRVTR